MEIRPRKLFLYKTQNGRIPYDEWHSSLKDPNTRLAIHTRLTRLWRGLLGDCKSVGDGVFELRIFVGPGYRVYLGLKDQSFVILLCGGDKKSQAQDIQRAKAYWNDYLRRTVL